MSDVGKLLVGWMGEGPRTPAETWAGLVRNHYCVSTISLAEDWRKGGFGTGGQGSNVTPA
jgi:hypothetical protein